MELVDPLGSPATWEDFLAQYPEATPFHSSAWARVLHRTYGHRSFHLRIVPENSPSVPSSSRPSSLIPLGEVRSRCTGCRGVGLPFADLAPPLLLPGYDARSCQDALIHLARQRNWDWLELRGVSREMLPDPSAPPAFLGHRLDLTPGLGILFEQLAGSVRRALRKAAASGLTFRVSRDREGIRQYMQLHALTRRRHGLPPQPRAFFENLQEECLSKADMGFVALAEGQGRAVAAAVFLRLGRQAVYKFGASDERNWDCRPNQFVMWEAIRHLAESGARSLHFGRTTPGQEGLLRYKRSWGAMESPIHYLRWWKKTGLWQPVAPAAAPGLSRSASLRSAFFRSLPAPLTRLAGRALYSHLD